MRSKKLTFMALSGSLLLVPLVGLSNVSHATKVDRQAIAAVAKPKLTWHGTITFEAGGYTPDAPGVKLAPGSIHLHEYMTLAAEFEKLYPGIHIKFLTATPYGNLSVVETKMAAGQLPDLWWQQKAWPNSILPNGVVVNLKPYLKDPNPFDGGKQWGSLIDKVVTATNVGPNGALYVLNRGAVGTAFYFNKRLFKKAGISHTPTTWAQLLQDCKILKAHGITPGADVPYYSWWSRLFLGNVLAHQMKKIMAAQPTVPTPTILDEAVAYHDGIMNPLKNPAIVGWWPLVKELYKYWDPNVSEIPVLNEPSGATTGVDLFEAQKVAMVYQGSWMPSDVKELKHPFAIGSFPFPSIVGSSPYATTANSSFDVGGWSGGLSISTPKADSSMNQPGKFKAVLTFLEFLATPQHDQAVVNELGANVATFVGVKADPGLGAVLKTLNEKVDFKPIWGFSDLTAEAHDQIFPLFQEYVTGHISFAAAKQQYATLAGQAVASFAAQEHIDWSKYK